MITKFKTANKLVENPQLSVALTQMSEAELKQLLNSIEALEIDLSRFVTLLNGAEPIKAVTVTQDLLKILSDEINDIFVTKQTKKGRNRLQIWDNEGGSVGYAPASHLLREVSSGKRCLIWTDIEQVQ